MLAVCGREGSAVLALRLCEEGVVREMCMWRGSGDWWP